MKKHVFSFALLAVSSAALVACGGNGGGSSDSSGGGKSAGTSFSGYVIDGYLENAQVCLDLDANATCDANEPTATTNSKGYYQLPATAAANARQATLLVKTTEKTKDAADGGKTLKEAGRKPFTLQAPTAIASAAGELNVTPFTTVVTGELLATYADLSKVSEADQRAVITGKVQELSLQHGISTEILRGADFVASKDAAAQALATQLANTLGDHAAAVAADATGKTLTPAQQQQAAVSMLQQSDESASVGSAVQQAKATPDDWMTILRSGKVFDPRVWLDGDSVTPVVSVNRYGYMALADGQSNRMVDEEFEYSNGAYQPHISKPRLIWGNGQWHKLQGDDWTALGKADAAGYVEMQEAKTGRTVQVAVRTVDVSGQPLETGLGYSRKYLPIAVDNATFPQGSIAYYIRQKFSTPEYKIQFRWDDNNTLNYALNSACGMSADCAYTSFDAAIDGGAWYVGGGVMVRRAASGGTAVELVEQKYDAVGGQMSTEVLGTVHYVSTTTKEGVQVCYLTGLNSDLLERLNMDSVFQTPALYLYEGKVAQGRYTAPPEGGMAIAADRTASMNKTALNAVLRAFSLPAIQ